MDPDAEEKLLAQRLISAAANLDPVAVRNLLPKASPKVRDDELGFTPLHAVVTACAKSKVKEAEACEIVTLLLDEGAIWNDLDNNNDTPGCIAHRHKLLDVYQLIVNAGVRAELLLQKINDLEPVVDEDEGGDLEVGVSAQIGTNPGVLNGTASAATEQNSLLERQQGNYLSENDQQNPGEDYIDHWDSNAAFLRSSLRFTDTQLLDSSSNAVMMDWETEIMSRHAEQLLPHPELRVMNIGHGMGIVDTAIQNRKPLEHHIVEAHPAVLQQMRDKGWHNKPGVILHEGRWQEVIPELIERGLVLDAIYYDTFAESYEDLKDLFEEKVIGLLDPAGRFSFYNGLGADRQVCYDVYKNVVELDLLDAGLQTEWEDIPVPTIDWQGVRRSYWNVDVYRLPTCTFIG